MNYITQRIQQPSTAAAQTHRPPSETGFTPSAIESVPGVIQDLVGVGAESLASIVGDLGNLARNSISGFFGAPDTSPVSGVSSAGLLGVGNAGPEVRELQEQLNARDQNIKVDGIFGPETEAAVRAFQETQKIDGKPIAVDGIVGPETRAALEQSKPAAAEAETPGSEAPDQDKAQPGGSEGEEVDTDRVDDSDTDQRQGPEETGGEDEPGVEV